MLEWINDESVEDLWANKFGIKDDKAEEADNFSKEVSEFFDERVSFPKNNEDDIKTMRSRIDTLSNVEWMEDDVFEDYWAMGVMFSNYEDNEGIMHVMIKTEDEIELKKRNRRKAHGCNQSEMSCYCKLLKELNLVSIEIDIDLCIPRIIWYPGGFIERMNYYVEISVMERRMLFLILQVLLWIIGMIELRGIMMSDMISRL